MTLIVYTIVVGFLYGVFVYKDMPRSFGGGLYSSVSLVLEEPENWQPLNILDDNDTRKTITLCLVTELENLYLLRIPSNGLSFTIPKDAVLSIIDVYDDEICYVPVNISSPQATSTP